MAWVGGHPNHCGHAHFHFSQYFRARRYMVISERARIGECARTTMNTKMHDTTGTYILCHILCRPVDPQLPVTRRCKRRATAPTSRSAALQERRKCCHNTIRIVISRSYKDTSVMTNIAAHTMSLYSPFVVKCPQKRFLPVTVAETRFVPIPNTPETYHRFCKCR